MKNKSDLLFGILYFALIMLGYLSNLFDSAFDNIYYGHLVNVFNYLIKAIIYIAGIIVLSIIYKKKCSPLKTEKSILSTRKKIVLYVITLFFITIVSILSNWQLKPLYDMGTKYTAIQFYDKSSEVGVFIILIYIMMKMFVHFDNFYVNNFKNYDKFSFSIIFVLLTFGVYRLIVDFSVFQFVFIPFTICLGFIYPYTNKSFFKTYLIALLVFLF